MNHDEITLVRRIRPETSFYDPASKAHARARMLGGTADRRRRRPRWTLVMALTATGALTAGFLVISSGETTVPNPLVRPVSAAEYLEKAAQVVEKEPDVRPKPHQWLFKKTVLKDSGGTAQSHESWMRADGKFAASREGSRMVIDKQYPGKDEQTPLREYATLLSLPTDPDSLRAWAYKTADRRFAKRPPLGLVADGPATVDARHSAAFEQLTGLFDDIFAPARLRAAAFRAIALIPGVEVLPKTTDILGRPVITVARMNEYGVRSEDMLDRTTYAHRTWGTVVIRNDLKQRPIGGYKGPDGKPVLITGAPRPIGDSHHEALASSAVVDHAGDIR